MQCIKANGARSSRSARTVASISSGVDMPGDTIIGYCHIGQQATAMLFAARTAGYKVLLYDGSFTDWQRRDLPVEKPAEKQ